MPQACDHRRERRTPATGGTATTALLVALGLQLTACTVRDDAAIITLEPTAKLTGHTKGVWHATFHHDGSRILSSSNDGTVRLWDLEGKSVAVLEGHTAGVRHAAFCPDGQRIVTASDDKTARVWDLEGNQIAVLQGHTGRLNQAAFSPDGNYIATTSENGAVLLFRMPQQ